MGSEIKSRIDALLYSNGQFSELTLTSSEESMSQHGFIFNLGFESENGDGYDCDREHSGCLSIYSAIEGGNAPYKYLLVLGSYVRSTWFVVEDEAHLMELRLKLAPLLVANILGSVLPELEHMAEKSFRKFHGHDYLVPCSQCDPEGWERHLERQAERRQQQIEREQESLRQKVADGTASEQEVNQFNFREKLRQQSVKKDDSGV